MSFASRLARGLPAGAADHNAGLAGAQAAAAAGLEGARLREQALAALGADDGLEPAGAAEARDREAVEALAGKNREPIEPRGPVDGPPPPDPDVEAAIEAARPDPAAAPPAQAPRMAPDLFRARAGAIASDRARPVGERVAALEHLAREGGYSFPAADLLRVAENGLAMLDLQPSGPGGPQRLTALRVRPPAAPARRPWDLEPGEWIDPRLHGVNSLARVLINARDPDAGRIAAQLAARARRNNAGEVPDAFFVGLVPDIERAIQWRREQGGRPYTGAISLDRRQGGERIKAPAPVAEAQGREMIEESNPPGAAIRATPPPETIRELAEEGAFRLGRALGYRRGRARRMGDEIRTLVEWTPVLGGIDLMQRGDRDVDNGRVAEGAGKVALGALDFVLPAVRKGGKVLLGAGELRALAEAGTDPAAIERALATTSDEALEAGADILIHTPDGARRIIGAGLADGTGRRWTARDILEGDGRFRLEIRPRGEPAATPKPAGGRPVRAGLATRPRPAHGDPERELDEIMARAAEAQREISAFGARHPVRFVDPGLKSRERILEKIRLDDYEGPAALKDIARGAFVVDSIDQGDRLAASLARRFKVEEDKGWVALRESGYLDRKLILRASNGERAEIQILPAPVRKVKGRTEEDYKIVRTTRSDELRAQANRRQRAVYEPVLVGTEWEALLTGARASRPSIPSGFAATALAIKGAQEAARDLDGTGGADASSMTGRSFRSRRAARTWARSNGIDLGGRHRIEKSGRRFTIVERGEGNSDKD